MYFFVVRKMLISFYQETFILINTLLVNEIDIIPWYLLECTTENKVLCQCGEATVQMSFDKKVFWKFWKFSLKLLQKINNAETQ